MQGRRATRLCPRLAAWGCGLGLAWPCCWRSAGAADAGRHPPGRIVRRLGPLHRRVRWTARNSPPPGPCSPSSNHSPLCRTTGMPRAAPCCNPTTWKSGPAPATPPPSCAPSAPSPGRPPTCSPAAPPQGRLLRREPEPPAALLPVPGGAKPAPANILELYLGSLEALGFDLKKPTTSASSRTTGENPTLGAWGLGWEVWLNGMEVTQFTYFQQVGGIDCKPITGEITYGLERLAMYLQGVDNVYDLTVVDDRRSDLRRRVPPERGGAEHLQLRAQRRRVPARPSARTRSRPAPDGKQQLALPAYERCSRRRTPSTCWTRAARSA